MTREERLAARQEKIDRRRARREAALRDEASSRAAKTQIAPVETKMTSSFKNITKRSNRKPCGCTRSKG